MGYLRYLLGAVGVGVAGAVGMAFAPLRSHHLKSNPRKIGTYDGAMHLIERIQVNESTIGVNPICQTIVQTHGEKTKRVILMLHGFTNAPNQFKALGDLFFEQGDNVYIPRMPYHGMNDPMTTELLNFTSTVLVNHADSALDVAQCLGDEVIVVGLSCGGLLASWLAQHRPEVSTALVISPSLAVQAIPLQWTPLAVRISLMLENRFVWWDENLKDAPIPPLHAYPRFPTHALAHMLWVGMVVLHQALTSAPQAKRVIVMLNPHDDAVENTASELLAERWRAHDPKHVEVYHFDADLKLIHDLIDPVQEGQQVDKVYPIIMDMVG